jgi:prepilin-type N-terminal cleavage/methylation domain-containing protein
MIKNNNGFTMMEMMIVVILMAIITMFAVPQYMKVTEQQRGVEALNIMAAIAKAEERFFVINEIYTEDFSDLDLDLIEAPENSDANSETFSNGAFTFELSGTTDAAGQVIATRANEKYALKRAYNPSQNILGDNQGEVCCDPLEDEGKELCEIFDIDECSSSSSTGTI